MKHAKFHTREHLFTLVDSLVHHKFILADLTGGEPTLHSDIIDLIAHATEKGLATRIITLGPYLQRPMHKRKGKLIDELLAAGLTDFRLSVHSVDADYWKERLNAPWVTQLANMNTLDERGFAFMTNTTVTRDNYKELPEIATEIARHQVYNSTLLFMMGHYQWSNGQRTGAIQQRYSEAAPYVHEFTEILEDARIAVVIRYAPLCTIKGLEKNYSGYIGVRYDPAEWMNCIDHKADPAKMTRETSWAMGRPIAQRVGAPSDGLELLSVQGKVGEHQIAYGRGRSNAISKVFPARPCLDCPAREACDGLEPQYLEHHGSGELWPYAKPQGRVIPTARLAYAPAYVVKLQPFADVKSAVRKAFESGAMSQQSLACSDPSGKILAEST